MSLFRKIKDRVADEVDAWHAAGEPTRRKVSAQAEPNGHTCNVCNTNECVGKNRQCNACIATYMGGA